MFENGRKPKIRYCFFRYVFEDQKSIWFSNRALGLTPKQVVEMVLEDEEAKKVTKTIEWKTCQYDKPNKR